MYKVVVADDEAIIAETLALILRYSGYQVAAFTSSSKALGLLKDKGADVLITDMLMPGMNGLELAAAASKVCPTCRVLILSGREMPDVQVQANGVSGCEFMLKPVQPEALLRKVEALAHMPGRAALSAEELNRYPVTTERESRSTTRLLQA